MQSALGATKYGMIGLAPEPDVPAAPAASNGAVTAAPAAAGWRAMLSPSEPEMWVLALGAVMFGLIAVSTSVRVGPLRASVGVGDD